MKHKSIALVVTVVAAAAACVWWGTREDEMARLARQEGMSRQAFLRSVELAAKARRGTLAKAEWPDLLAMARSENPFLKNGARCAMVGVARFGPCREEALSELGDWLDYPRIAYMARAPGWEQKVQGLLASNNPEDVKAANWVLAVEKKRKAGDPKYVRLR